MSSYELTTIETTANRFLEVAHETQANLKLLKFTKGKYFIGDDDVTGCEYIAYVDQMARGYVKFVDGKVTEQRVGKVADGFKVPARQELGDNDETLWEKDSTGKPRDPWSYQFYIPMSNVETGDTAVFVTSSHGGKGAVGRLSDIYAKNIRNGRPIIKLAVESYRHTTFGRIETPNFMLVSWDQGAVNSEIDVVATTRNDMDDDIPF
jgi:hypothetical protein